MGRSTPTGEGVATVFVTCFLSKGASQPPEAIKLIIVFRKETRSLVFFFKCGLCSIPVGERALEFQLRLWWENK